MAWDNLTHLMGQVKGLEFRVRNKHRTAFLTFNGETKSLDEWAVQLGVSKNCLMTRLLRGWTLEKALTKEKRKAHGLTKTGEYASWYGMHSRCSNPKTDRYKDYGGRGVRVCERWKDFLTFLADMGPKPSPEHTLDRFPDNDGNYEPGNCRWATPAEQGRNRRDNCYLTCQGRTMTMTDWAAELGITPATLWCRLHMLGWSIERALTTPARR